MSVIIVQETQICESGACNPETEEVTRERDSPSLLQDMPAILGRVAGEGSVG